MRVVRLSFALCALAAAAACGTRSPTAPPAREGSGGAHRNEGFLGSGNNVTGPTSPDTMVATGTAPVR